MSLVGKLIGFGFRQVIGSVAGDDAGEAAGKVIQLVEQHFTDHSQKLPKALAKANDRAWQALSIALAGETFLDKINLFFATGDDKGIREQVRLFLQDKSISFEGTSADFRKKCLTELIQAKKAGLLSAQKLIASEVGQQAAMFQRYADLKGMVDGAEQVVRQIAGDLAPEYPNLANLLQQRPAGKPPLLVSAFAFFFREIIEHNRLAQGLIFDEIRKLSASQATAFGKVYCALISLGDKFDQIFEQLDRIEAVVVETHGAVLDMQAELQRLGSLHLANAGEVRRLMQDVLNHVSQAGMFKGEVKPQHSFSIRSEDERAAVKQLLARFRQLPDNQQKQVPALHNGLGKLQFGSQDFDGARKTFAAVAEEVHDATAKAEAQFNWYRAALEEKKWDDALAAIQKASSLDSQRFAPFPMQRYQAKKILGAGGFGTAFHCHDKFLDAEVVVKTLHDGAMERKMAEVFREAQLLGLLHHPPIIGMRDCSYADLTQMARPYIVTDYFPGSSLENHIQQGGTLLTDDLLVVARQIAQGMQAAHQQNILHRDLKPDNVLVCKEGSTWKVKIIDFGLALRKQTIETGKAAGNTILGNSVAGTLKYAPPEQMGELKDVEPGPYSDVYSFGKLCCYALFKRTVPNSDHWSTIPKEHKMLEGCTEQEVKPRPHSSEPVRLASFELVRLPSFEPVLKVLEALDPIEVQRKKEEEARQKAELERKRREEEEEEARQKAELERKRREKEEEEARQKAELERKRREEEKKKPGPVNCPPLRGDSGRYVLWLDSPLVETPRFVHFSWKKYKDRPIVSFKIRDYVSGVMQHQPEGKETPEAGFHTINPCQHKHNEVWQLATLWIPAQKELFHEVKDFDWWVDKLSEMTNDRNKFASRSLRPPK